jgi:hypothetical protein
MIYTIYSLDLRGDLCAPMKITADSDAEALHEGARMLAPNEHGEVWRQGSRVGEVRGGRRST